jgi:hypothetical protein
LLLLVGGGCPGSSECLQPDSGGVRTVQIKGRVVDFETCLTTSGCQGVSGLRVALFFNSAVFSEGTGPNGTFTINGVPDGTRNYLYVTDAGQSGVYLSSLQAEAVTVQGSDEFGLELFVLKREGSLYAGISSEAGVDIQSHPLYLGQVFKVESGTMKAISDVTMRSAPDAQVRYVNCIPKFQQCAGQPTLFANRDSTGVFGQFVVLGTSEGEHAIWGTAKDYVVEAKMAPLGRGYITIGTHNAELSTTPSTDGGI